MPFEVSPGLVSRGGKLFSARRWVGASGGELSFTQLMMNRLGSKIRTGSQTQLYGLMRDDIVSMMDEGVLTPESFEGYVLGSRQRIRANQVIFDPRTVLPELDPDFLRLFTKAWSEYEN